MLSIVSFRVLLSYAKYDYYYFFLVAKLGIACVYVCMTLYGALEMFYYIADLIIFDCHLCIVN